MKAKKIILWAFIAIFTFSSCNGQELGRCDLPKGLIPYKKGEVYSFIDGAKQVIDIPVTKSIWEWEQSRDENEHDYFTYRYQIVSLENESNNLRINFHIDADAFMFGRDYNEMMVSVGYSDYGCVFALSINAKGNILTGNVTYAHADASTFFHDSIEVNNKVYYDVIEQKIEYNDKKNCNQLFYNKTYGILQVNRDGELFLTINHKTEDLKSSINADMLNEEFGTTSINNVKINTSETKLLRIFAVTGALVYSSSTNFDLKSVYLSQGIYIVETTNNLGEVKQEKIVVK